MHDDDAEYYIARIKACQVLADRATNAMEKQAFVNAMIGYRGALKRCAEREKSASTKASDKQVVE